ncbi:MAG: flagellar hook-associated protein FlgL [Nitrospinae bacterium]|nr:flagellar hook-associated protein FlgL [Nitrospinota bacterium]
MALRVTNMMSQNTLLNNINTINYSLMETQQQLASGKRVNKPSDNPVNARSIIEIQSTISRDTQYLRNIDYSRRWLEQSETALSQASNLISRAKEITVQMSNSVAYDTQNMINVATEVKQMISETISLGNTTVGSRYLFGGTNVGQPPVASGGIFFGNSKVMTTRMDEFTTFDITTSASKMFVSDFNPIVSANTTIASLNKGAGATLGAISITNRAGTTANVNLAGLTTVGQVITAINASGLGITAAINATNDGISLTDANASPVSNLIVANADTTNTASALKILGNRSASSISGGDIDPAATASTLISELNGGAGLTLGDINIANGAASGVVTLTAAATLNDVLTTINASAMNVTATINATGTGINVTSNVATTIAVVNEVGNGKSAANLGIQGGNNMLKTLELLDQALVAGDANAVRNLMGNMNTITDNISQVRADIGGRVNRLDSKMNVLEDTNLGNEVNLTYMRDTDMTQAAMQFSLLQTNQNAALSTASKILNTSLVDFLR